jgi:hypothetical protein
VIISRKDIVAEAIMEKRKIIGCADEVLGTIAARPEAGTTHLSFEFDF